MRHLLTISDVLGRFVVWVGRLASWSAMLLMAVILFDVVSRRIFAVGSAQLQELEWHLHTILFMFCLALGYMHNTHVRIEIISERLPERVRCWIEALGCVLFLIPFCLIIIYYGGELTHRSWLKGEVSSSATGLPYRWLIKSVIPLGMSLLLLSAISVFLRRLVMLVRPDLCPSAGTGPDQEGRGLPAINVQ